MSLGTNLSHPDGLVRPRESGCGDLAFQRKCFRKMEELGASAGSVIFASHDLSAISSLCDRCIVLDKGRVLFDGPTSEAVMRYYELNPVFSTSVNYDDSSRRVGDPHARLLGAEIATLDGTRILEANLNQPFTVVMRYCVLHGTFL